MCQVEFVAAGKVWAHAFQVNNIHFADDNPLTI